MEHAFQIDNIEMKTDKEQSSSKCSNSFIQEKKEGLRRSIRKKKLQKHFDKNRRSFSTKSTGSSKKSDSTEEQT